MSKPKEYDFNALLVVPSRLWREISRVRHKLQVADIADLAKYRINSGRPRCYLRKLKTLRLKRLDNPHLTQFEIHKFSEFFGDKPLIELRFQKARAATPS